MWNHFQKWVTLAVSGSLSNDNDDICCHWKPFWFLYFVNRDIQYYSPHTCECDFELLLISERHSGIRYYNSNQLWSFWDEMWIVLRCWMVAYATTFVKSICTHLLGYNPKQWSYRIQGNSTGKLLVISIFVHMNLVSNFIILYTILYTRANTGWSKTCPPLREKVPDDLELITYSITENTLSG